MPLDQGEIDDGVDSTKMSFFRHIDALRGNIIRSVIVLIVLIAVCFSFIETIFNKIIIAPIHKEFFTYRMLCKFSHSFYHSDKLCVDSINIQLVNLKMQGQFVEAFKISIIAAIIIGFPYFVWEIWRFIKPGLKSSERKKTTTLVASLAVLFFMGVLFGYFVLTPISLNFFIGFTISDQITNNPTFQNIVSLISFLVIGTGLMFELPILMYFLARLGLISSSFLRKYKKYAVLIIIIIAAVVTPPDIFSQVILAIPIYLLYELGIHLTKNIEKKREEEVYG